MCPRKDIIINIILCFDEKELVAKIAKIETTGPSKRLHHGGTASDDKVEAARFSIS